MSQPPPAISAVPVVTLFSFVLLAVFLFLFHQCAAPLRSPLHRVRARVDRRACALFLSRPLCATAAVAREGSPVSVYLVSPSFFASRCNTPVFSLFICSSVTLKGWSGWVGDYYMSGLLAAQL
ncbi:hypothetical protein IWX91DRAFT_336876, partial [Phyllosticta citricarpa]